MILVLRYYTRKRTWFYKHSPTHIGQMKKTYPLKPIFQSASLLITHDNQVPLAYFEWNEQQHLLNPFAYNDRKNINKHINKNNYQKNFQAIRFASRKNANEWQKIQSLKESWQRTRINMHVLNTRGDQRAMVSLPINRPNHSPNKRSSATNKMHLHAHNH